MGGGELVTADEPTVVSEPFLDAVVVEDGEGDGGLSDTPRTDESDWGEIFCEADDLVDQLVTPETDSRWLWRRFSWKDTTRR